VLAGLCYHFVAVDERPKPRQVEAVSAEPKDKKLQNDVVARLLREPLADPSAGRQAELSAKLSDLDDRLRSIEALNQKKEEVPKSDVRKPEVAEADLASWMDEGLRTEAWDKTWTDLTTAAIEQGLVHSPEIKLEELDCNRRVCRAMFSQDDGQRPDASKLFGLMPNTQEGFTIEEPDGRVKVYFTRAGESLANLRTEAVASI